jgi:hypothetical protein
LFPVSGRRRLLDRGLYVRRFDDDANVIWLVYPEPILYLPKLVNPEIKSNTQFHAEKQPDWGQIASAFIRHLKSLE